jgi:CspA family cold shock protein
MPQGNDALNRPHYAGNTQTSSAYDAPNGAFGRDELMSSRLRRGPVSDPRIRAGARNAPAGGSDPNRRLAVGTITELSRERGFGFLTDGAGRKRFFHRSAVLGGAFDTLRERQKVEFEPKDDVKGLRAANVRPASAATGRGVRRGATLESAGRPSGRYGGGGSTRSSLDPRRSVARGADSANSGWRSSLSPFRGDPPPSGQPRRRR